MNLRHAVQDILAPTTVLVGSDNTAIPLAIAEDIVRRIPSASLQVLTCAQHVTPLEWPDQIITALHQNGF